MENTNEQQNLISSKTEGVEAKQRLYNAYRNNTSINHTGAFNLIDKGEKPHLLKMLDYENEAVNKVMNGQKVLLGGC